MKKALEKNFHYNKVSTLTHMNFSSNLTRHKAGLTRKERLEREQIENSIFIHKVVNKKNASPRLQRDGFGNYEMVCSSNCSSNKGSYP